MGLEDDPFTAKCSQFQVTCYTLEINMEPENHLFEKEKNLQNLHFSVLLQLCRGGKLPGGILALKSYPRKFWWVYGVAPSLSFLVRFPTSSARTSY